MEKKNRKLPAWLLVLLQLLLTGAVLCVFALFHHVIPTYQLRRGGLPEPIAKVEHAEAASTPAAETGAPAETEAPTEIAAPAEIEAPQEPEAAAETEAPAEMSVPEEPEEQSLRERYADRFSEEPVWEDLSYRGPTMSVELTRYEYPELCPDSVCFVADILLTDPEQIRAAFPLGGYSFARPDAIARDAEAVIAVNGDCFANQRGNFVVRNGEIYSMNETTADICALYLDGRMETYGPGEYEIDEVLANEPIHIWHFGPALLNGDGSPRESFNISALLQDKHPRTAIGYYEPGHYCFVVIDGRQGGYSAGADMRSLAAFMSSLGCRSAYNLDGGASSVMVFHGQIVNHPAENGRDVNDMIAVCERKEGQE